jgi:hypothetical protein
MIYNKNATFPYPVLTNNTKDYINSFFSLDIELNDNTAYYVFSVKYELGSEFLMKSIKNNDAKLVLIIQSKDSKFYELNNSLDPIYILKSRISLNKRTSLQLIIKANKNINFEYNLDLDPFYCEMKNKIIVNKYELLALSNVVIFDGSNKKPFEIFEKKLDDTLKSEISIELGEETIIINYKSEEFQFATLSNNNVLNYPYIYMGLQKALYKIIVDYGGESEAVSINNMEVPENGLNFKLYNLMRSKMIDELTINNIDEVIYKISDKILEKFTRVVKGIGNNGN